MQAGSRQWWHEVVSVCSDGCAALPPWSTPTVRHSSPSSRPFRLWQPVTQDLQPVQASRSTSNAYCWPAPGGAIGKSARYRSTSAGSRACSAENVSTAVFCCAISSDCNSSLTGKHFHAPVAHARGVDRDLDVGMVETLPGAQIE